MPRLIFISDTHTYHRRVEIPEGDILICTGDITSSGEMQTMEDFNTWLGEQSHKHKILILGNHEVGTELVPKTVKDALFNNAIYLEDSEVVIDGIKFYGSPYQPWFYDWEYNFPEHDNGKAATKKWNQIPYNTNVLLTHGPVYGILDKVERGTQAGCPYLRKRLLDLPGLKVHACGHIHEAYGQEEHDGVHYVNASICTLKYKPTNKAIVLDI